MSSRIVAEASGYDREEQAKLNRVKTNVNSNRSFLRTARISPRASAVLGILSALSQYCSIA